MSKFKASPNRRANATERKIAETWVELYRKAQAAPDGRYCLNDDVEHEEDRVFIDASDPSMLIHLLDTFAKHGKFSTKEDKGIEGLVLRAESRRLQEEGNSYYETLYAMADRYEVSSSTIERRMRLTRLVKK